MIEVGFRAATSEVAVSGDDVSKSQAPDHGVVSTYRKYSSWEHVNTDDCAQRSPHTMDKIYRSHAGEILYPSDDHCH